MNRALGPYLLFDLAGFISSTENRWKMHILLPLKHNEETQFPTWKRLTRLVTGNLHWCTFHSKWGGEGFAHVYRFVFDLAYACCQALSVGVSHVLYMHLHYLCVLVCLTFNSNEACTSILVGDRQPFYMHPANFHSLILWVQYVERNFWIGDKGGKMLGILPSLPSHSGNLHEKKDHFVSQCFLVRNKINTVY